MARSGLMAGIDGDAVGEVGGEVSLGSSLLVRVTESCV